MNRGRRWIPRLTGVALGLSLASTRLTGFGAEPAPGNHTTVGVEAAHFTLNNRPTFLLGFSYYGALGAPEDFMRSDLIQLRACGFNWLRAWATWSAYGSNVSAVTTNGLPREPHFTRLKWLVAECDRLGLVVDVTLTRGASNCGRHIGHRPETIQELVPRSRQRTGCWRCPPSQPGRADRKSVV